MDWVRLKEAISDYISKYKYLVLIFFVGILLMVIPGKQGSEITVPDACDETLVTDPGQELEQILKNVEGVGKVQVMLTQSIGPLTQYQTDEDIASDGSIRRETMIVTDENRSESGLVKSVTHPIYLGAIVVCQGAGNPSVKLAVTEAVSSVTGLSTDRITVLKMK